MTTTPDRKVKPRIKPRPRHLRPVETRTTDVQTLPATPSAAEAETEAATSSKAKQGARGSVYRHTTDTGNAERLVALYGDKMRFCPPYRAWFVWDGRIWARDDGLQLMQFAKATVRQMLKEAVAHPNETERKARIRHCLASESTAKLRAMVENAQSELVVRPQELDSDPYLFCCENGTLDLRTGKLRKHDPADLVTLMAPVAFDPSATDTRWEELLDKFVRPDEGKEAFLQRSAFASLTGTTSDKAFLNLYDDNNGDTGKTTFMESLLAAWGPYGDVVNAEAFLTNPRGAPGIRSDLAALAGKRLVVSSETPPGRKLDTALMKKLTQGNGTYKFERKYENPWSGSITFTIWLDGNSVAKANAEDNPLFNRWRLTPFTHKIDKAAIDKRWLERAAASPEFRAAVLAWAVAGRRAWLKDGIGTAPSVERATAEVRASMDPLREFWEACCEFGVTTPADRYFTPTDAFMDRYQQWVLGSPGVREINRDDVLRLLKGRDGVTYRQRRVDGTPKWGWDGVRLRKPLNVRVPR